MRQAIIVGSVGLGLALAYACGGETLVVDRDPGDGSGASTGGDGDGDGTPAGDGDGTPSGDGDGDGRTGQGTNKNLPCDLFEADGHACVSAHSTVRLLRSQYDGPLYQVCRTDDSPCMGEGLDVSATSAGYADAAAQDDFCPDNDCFISIIYDQSGQGNHLAASPPGSAAPTYGKLANARALPTLIDGHPAYGVLIRPGMGYRAACNDCVFPEVFPSGVPVGDEPETMYMITSQHDAVNGCCFNYGNAEITQNNDGNGTMEAVNYSFGVIWGSGEGEGPWVMADLENGLFAGWENGREDNISSNTTITHDFITAVLVGDTADKNKGNGRFALYGGDAQAGTLETKYDGIRPEKPGYVPMLKQGSIILGIGGDNSKGSGGRFYEGALVLGAASKETLDALQAAIVTAGYSNE